MSKSFEFGKYAEKLAVDFLKSKYYEIIETNWRYSNLEIDIIATKDNFIVITEVKARNNENLNFEEVVTLKKQKNLINATEKYLEINNLDLEVRFDVIFVYKQKNTFKINHIENAFYPLIE